jgi:hypothetical protein
MKDLHGRKEFLMLNVMNDQEAMEVASVWLSQIDSLLADLIDKSERMTVGAFYKEVEAVIETIPQLFGQVDTKALTEALENAIADGILEGLDQ